MSEKFEDQLRNAIDRAIDGLVSWRECRDDIADEDWDDARDSADHAGKMFNKARLRMFSIRDTLDNLEPEPGPDPRVFTFTFPGLPYTPKRDDDLPYLFHHIEAPAGRIKSMSLKMVMSGVPENADLNKILAWWTGARRQAGKWTHYGMDQFFYGLWKQRKLTWRVGIGTPQGPPPAKTKDVLPDAPFSPTIQTQLEFKLGMEPRISEVGWDGDFLTEGSNFPVNPSDWELNGNGMALSLSGQAFNPNETPAYGVVFEEVTGSVEYYG